MLTQEQLHANVAALKKQGATDTDITSYIKSVQPKTDFSISGEDMATPGPIGSVGRFLGMEKAGQFAGAQLAKLSPEHQANLATAEQANPETARILSRGGDFTNRELVGSVLQTAGNIALPFAGKALTAGKTAAVIGKGAAVGAASGFAGGLESGQDNSNVIVSTLLGGVIGGAIPAVGAAYKGWTKASSGIPEKFYDTIFKNTADDVFKQLKTQGIDNIQKTDPENFAKLVDAGIVRVGKSGVYELNDTIAKQALDRGLRGSLPAMANSVVKMNLNSELALRDIVKTYTKPVTVPNKKGLTNVLTGIISDFEGQYNESSMVPSVKNMIKQVKTGKVDAQTALDIRRLLDKQRIAASYRAIAGKISISQESYKMASDALRAKLNEIPGIAPIMKDYAFSIEALQHIATAAKNRGNSEVLSLVDALMFGQGNIVGGPIMGTTFGVARRAITTPRMLTNAAQGLNTLGRATAPLRSLTGRAVEAVKPVARTAAYNAIAGTGRLLQ